MSRTLAIDPKDAVPIWRQIEEGMRHLVASGALRPGKGVPSVRDLARDLSVNPNTVVKAYQRLTDSGILVVRRGEGTYVADAPPALPRAERSRALRDGAMRYANLAVTIGAAREESVAEVEKALGSLDGKKGGRS
jgi:GntR family transcriptional regulator